MSETNRRKSGKVDAILADAIDIALQGLSPIAKPEEIGKHLAVTSEGERLATHSFECLKPGYRGWHWVAVLARAVPVRFRRVAGPRVLRAGRQGGVAA